MNAKLFLKNTKSWCAAYIVVPLAKVSQKKSFLLFRKMSVPAKAQIAAINWKEGTILNNVYFCSDHFEEACFDKNGTLQAQLFYTPHLKKRKLVAAKVDSNH